MDYTPLSTRKTAKRSETLSWIAIALAAYSIGLQLILNR